MAASPPTTTIESLNAASQADFIGVVAPLFEGAPRFLVRLAAARPFSSIESMFGQARSMAHEMPEPEQIELIDAHPRLGAPPGSVSSASFVEQGYDRPPSGPERVAAELERLNAAYESRFGFRYCVFVAGRSRAELLPGFEAALAADRQSEIGRALDAVVDIAIDRFRKTTQRDESDPQ